MYPFKHNNKLNKRWDARNHPFQKHAINGNNMPNMDISLENNSGNVNEPFKKILLKVNMIKYELSCNLKL